MNELIYKCLVIPIQPSCESEDEPDDFLNLEIAVIGTWASWKLPGKKWQVFTLDNLEAFQALVGQAETIIGFNSLRFDDLLLETYRINITTNFDLLYEILGRVKMSGLETKFLTEDMYQYYLNKYPIIAQYSLEKFAQANLGSSSFMTNEQISSLWTSGQHKKVIQQCLYQVKQLKKLKDLYDQMKLYDPFYGRPVRHRFIIPVPTKTLYQKMVALALGALFRPDGNYAFLCRYKDYEHYALLCCERAD